MGCLPYSAGHESTGQQYSWPEIRSAGVRKDEAPLDHPPRSVVTAPHLVWANRTLGAGFSCGPLPQEELGKGPGRPCGETVARALGPEAPEAPEVVGCRPAVHSRCPRASQGPGCLSALDRPFLWPCLLQAPGPHERVQSLGHQVKSGSGSKGGGIGIREV